MLLALFQSGEEGDDAELEAPKIYEPIVSFQQLSDRLSFFEAQYNELVRGSQMDLVFFKVSCESDFQLYIRVLLIQN